MFFAKALIQMDLSIPDYERIFAEGRWSMEGFQQACKVLDSVPTEWFEVFEASVWCWSDGAQNDSHARIRTARSFTAGIRSRIPQSERRSVVESMSDLLEDTATRGSFNFDGAVRTLKIDPDARESDWLKAMGDCGFESTNPQGGTFSSGTPAVGSRNGHGNAEGVASFCGFAGHDYSSSNDGTLAGFNEVESPVPELRRMATELAMRCSLVVLPPGTGKSTFVKAINQQGNQGNNADLRAALEKIVADADSGAHVIASGERRTQRSGVSAADVDEAFDTPESPVAKQPGQPQTSKAPKVRVYGSLPVLKKLVRVDSSNGRKVFLSNQLRSLET